MPSKAAVDLSEFEALNKPAASRCAVGAALDALPPQEAEQLRAALAAAFTHTAIRAWLGKRGFKMAEQTIGRHRKKECCCARA